MSFDRPIPFPAKQITVFIGIGSIVEEQKNPSNPRVKLSDLLDIALDDRDSVICIFWSNPFIKQGDVLLGGGGERERVHLESM